MEIKSAKDVAVTERLPTGAYEKIKSAHNVTVTVAPFHFLNLLRIPSLERMSAIHVRICEGGCGIRELGMWSAFELFDDVRSRERRDREVHLEDIRKSFCVCICM